MTAQIITKDTGVSGSTPPVGYMTLYFKSGLPFMKNALGVESALSGNIGSVTSVGIAGSNGFSGSVANASTTPVITLTATPVGILKSNGTAMSAAAAATDFVAPSAYASANGHTMNTAKMLGRATAGNGAAEEIATTGTGSAVLATSPTLVTPTLGAALGTSWNGNVWGVGTGTLSIGAGKTFTISNSITMVGTDGALITFPPGAASLGYLNFPQNSQSAAYTTVMADSGKHIFHPTADVTARNFTIDSNANVAYPIGTELTFVNQNGAGVITVKITTDTMRLAGAGTTGDRTLAANGIAKALKVTATEWIISGTGLT